MVDQASQCAGGGVTLGQKETARENDWLGIQTKTTEAISAIQTAFEPFAAAVQAHLQGALVEVQAFATGNETEWTNANRTNELRQHNRHDGAYFGGTPAN